MKIEDMRKQANDLILSKNYSMAGNHMKPEAMSQFTLGHFIQMLEKYECKNKKDWR